MSRTIDEKVVEMRFDNQDFEKNVSQSMSTLDKLKSALDFSGVDKTFSGLTSAANKLDLGGVGDAIENVGNKFSWLETVATGALLNIGASIESKLINTLKSVTVDQVASGFDKYADKSKAVQTIMAATGKEIGEVSDELDRLMWFTDETSYSFQDMVGNISKFTSNAVDLDKAVTAMEGISNWAAISGMGKNEAGRVMYNLSQALSMGAVTLQDWKSIELANMGTEEFRKMAINVAVAQGALGKFFDDDTGEEFYATYTLDEFGNKIADVEVDWLNFRDTLKEKWFNKDVLMETLNLYGGFADKLSEVYNEINENEGVDVTTSQLIKMTQQFIDNTLDMDQAMAITGKSAEELTAIFTELGSSEYELGRKAFAAAQEARTFQDAIDATKDAVSTQFMRTFEIIFGNYEEAKVLWTDLANEMWEIFAGPISDMNDVLQAWKGLKIGGREDFIEGLKNIYRAIRSVVDPIGEAWDEIFPALTFQRLGEIVAGFKNFTESLILSEEQMSAVSSAFQGIFGIMKIVGDGAKELAGTYLSRYFSGFDGFTDAVFQNIRNIGSYLDNLIHILPRMKSAREAFAEGQIEALAYIQKWEKTEAFVQKLSDIFGKLKESAGVLGDLGAKFLNLKDSINAFYNEGGGAAGVLEVIAERFADVMRAVEELVHIWTGVDIAKWVDPIVRALFNFQDAIKVLQSDGTFATFKDKFLGIFDAFESRFGSILSWFAPLKDAFASIINDFFEGIGKLTGGGIGDMTSAFRNLLETIGGWFDAAKNFINTSEVLKNVIDTIKDSIQIIADFLADFLSLSKTIDTFTEAGGGFAGVLAVINDKFKAILNVIGELIERTTGWDLASVGQTILNVIKVVENGLLRLADLIAGTLGWEDNPFHRILESSDSAYNQLQNTFDKFSFINLSGFDELGTKISQKLTPLNSLFEGFKDFFVGIWSVIQKVLPLLGSALSWVGTQLAKFGETLSGMELKDILDMIRTGGLALLFFKMAKAFDGVGEVLDAWQTKLKADTLRSIGFAILEIAGAALIIGMIPKDTIVEALVGIGEAFAGLIATVFSVMSLSGGASARSIAAVSTTMIAIGAAMVEIAIALQALVVPLKTIAAMDSEELDRGLKGVLYALGELAGALGAVGLGQLLSGGKLKEGTKSLKTIASALLLVLGVIKLYTLIDTDEFEKGLEGIDRVVTLLGKIAGMLGLFTVGLTVIDALITHFSGAKTSAMSQAGVGIKNIAVALLALSASLWVLSKIDPEKFASAVSELAVAFVALGVTSVVISALVGPLSKLSKAMEGLGKGVFLLTVSAMAIGAVAYIFGDAAEKLAKATGDLIVALLHVVAERAPLIVEDLITILMSIIDGIVAHTPEIVDALMRFITGALEAIRPYVGEITAIIMDIVKEVISEVNKALEGVDMKKMAEGGGFLGGLMLSILGLGKLAGSPKEALKSFLAFETLLAGALVVIAELGLVFGALGALAESSGGVDAIKSFGEVAEVMGNVLISKFGILFAGIMVLVEVQKYISDFLKATPARMLDSFKLLSIMIFYTSTLVGEMGLLFGALGALSKIAHGKEAMISFGEVAGVLADILTSKVGALLGAIVTVLGIVTAIFDKIKPEQRGESLKSISGALWDAVAVVIEAIAAVSAIVDAMAVLFALGGGLIAGLDWLIGGWNDLPDNAIERGINKFGDILEAIGDVIGRFIGAITGPVVEAFEHGKITGILTGFTDGLVYFAENSGPFFDALEGLGDNGIELAESFVDMIYKLTAAEFLDAINIFKDKNYKELGNKFAELGNAVNAFAEKTADLDQSVVEKAATCAQIVTALAQEMPSTNGLIQWIMGEKNMGLFGKNLTLLGAGLESFQGSTEGLSEEAFNHATIVVKVAAEMSEEIPVNRGLIPWILGMNDMGKFGTDLALLGAGMKSFQENTAGISEDAIKSAAVCAGVLIEMSKEIPDQGNWFRDLFTDNTSMDDFGKNLESFGKSFKNYTDSIKGISQDTLDKTQIATGVISEIAKVATTISMFKNSFVQDGKKIALSLDDFEDFGKKLKSLGENLKSYAKSIKDVDTGKLSAITKGISELIDVGTKTSFKDSFFDLFQSFSEGMVKAFDDQNGIIAKFKGYLDTIIGIPDATLYNLKFTAAGGSIGKAISKGFADAQSLTATVQEVLDELIGIITSEQNIESFNKTGRQLLAAFGDGFTNASFTASWQRSFGEYLDNIAAMITDETRLQKVRSAGVTFALAIFEGMQNADATSAINKITETISNGIGTMDLSGVTTKLTTTINTVLNNVDVTQASTAIGSNMSAGVAQGMTSQESTAKVAQAAQKVIESADEAARKAAVIRSPSRLFAIIGQFLDEGLAEGIFDNIPVVEDAVSSVIGAIADGTSGQSLIDMMKASGFNISDTFGSSILEASDDIGDYGGLVSQMFADGMFDNLTGVLGTDFVTQYASSMNASLPSITSISEEYGYEVGEAWDEGTLDYLNSQYSYDIQSTSVDAMSSALPTVSSYSYQYGTEVGEAWGEGYHDEMLEIEDTYANLEIQGPTVTFNADTSKVKEAMDEFLTYYGQEFAKNGELDGYLLAFDMADEAGKRAMIEQAQYEWANDELANTLRLRQIQADELLMQDAYWQNMASSINASSVAGSGNYESDYVTKDDLIEATTGMKEEIEGLRSDNQNMMLKLVNANVYLDSGELVGALAPGLDRQFGNLQKLGGRGI